MKVLQPRRFDPRKTLLVGTVLAALIVFALLRDPPTGPDRLHWTGHTMGTYYDIKVAQSPFSDVEARRIHQEIQQYFDAFNRALSTYLPDSEISRFNASDSTEPFPVSPEFAAVTRLALHWADSSGGAFDPTLDPLINLWGFGHRGRAARRPAEEEILEALSRTGFRAVTVPDDSHVRKERPEIQLNLNAIAKGYAADAVARLLREAGAGHVYVEIGGDLVVSGRNPDGIPWRIGLEYPRRDLPRGERLAGIAHIQTGAFAGSGDYRQYVTDDEGNVFSHIIDPRSGHSAMDGPVAVTVWAGRCADADAVATALMVLPLAEGLDWVESLPGVEALFFTPSQRGEVELVYSAGFVELTGFQALPPPATADE